MTNDGWSGNISHVVVFAEILSTVEPQQRVGGIDMTMAWLTGNSQPERELVLEQNTVFAVNIVKEALGERVDMSNTIYRTISTCVAQVLTNCESQIRQLVAQLDLSRGIGCEKFSLMADELFEADKGYVIHWERIITLFAFTWVLSQHLQALDQAELSKTVGKILAGYLNEKISAWILQNGGWVKIHEEFSDDSSSSNKWKYFFLTGLGIGLVATYKLTH